MCMVPGPGDLFKALITFIRALALLDAEQTNVLYTKSPFLPTRSSLQSIDHVSGRPSRHFIARQIINRET